jgi:hypothetical protein
MQMNEKYEVLIYKSADGLVKIDVRMEGETLWLTQAQIAELFGRDKSVINRHINNILKEDELDEKVVVANFAITTQHGAIEGKTQEHDVKHYSLDMILAVGYRENSPRGTNICICATGLKHLTNLQATLVLAFCKVRGALSLLKRWEKLIASMTHIEPSYRMI